MSGCVLDTDVVVAALDRRDSHHSKAAGAIRSMLEDGIPLLLSLVNYAETLVRPAEDETSLRTAVDALSALSVQLVAPSRAIALDAARHRNLGVSLADGFALATADANDASVASFDRRVRRILPKLRLELAPQLK